ncbi:hypothetical protein [Rhodopseudomonas sp. B29]|uniref:hypothetical protein n=1 Tax=Rhodopseudomonas sp. B29 TaxID=95607 RepID=UPI00034A370D|nr:hypothetical protein [Rhodopseudomonas sp. B29]
MHAEIYTDGIEEITVGGSIVRVDLISLSPTERDANNAPKKVFRQRVIFNVEAFANSVEVMQKALQGLIDAGVIKRNHPRLASEDMATASATTADTVTLASNTSRNPNASANFR